MPEHLKPFQFKKGQSGNPKGRPRRKTGPRYPCGQLKRPQRRPDKVSARVYRLRYEAKNRTQINVRSRKRRIAQNAALHNFVKEYKATHPCADCGQSDPRFLEFDHRDYREKKYLISLLTSRGASFATLKKEIAKCDIRCTDCHKKKTAAERHLWARPKTKAPPPLSLQLDFFCEAAE